MEAAECSLCGQTIIRYPFEDEWHHGPEYDKVDYGLCDAKGCFCKALPAKERRGAHR